MKSQIAIVATLLSAILSAGAATPPPGPSLGEMRDQSAERKNATARNLEIKEWKISENEWKQFFRPVERSWTKIYERKQFFPSVENSGTRKTSPPQTAETVKAEPRTISCNGANFPPDGPWAMYDAQIGSLVVKWPKEEIEKFDASLKKYRAGVKTRKNRR